MTRRRGAWIRYGDRLSDEQVEFAARHYRVAVLQPWETAGAARLKALSPATTVLAYKCLSSTRSYEPGPRYSSGVCSEEAEEAGEHWFAHRLDGSRIEWSTYPGHWQMATWEEEYQERWCDNVADELEDSPFDGVMADNDVYDDYYGLRPPLEGGRTMADLRAVLDAFVPRAGRRLNSMGKLLVPNIAESRRDPGRWDRHASYGGGFEEVWLGWTTEDYFDPATTLAQMPQLTGPGLTVLRVPSDGTDEHPNFRYALAASWVFGGDADVAIAATAHDAYSTTPWIPELDWDLGTPRGAAVQRGNGWSREFTGGWAVVNLNEAKRRRIRYDVPAGLVGADGTSAPEQLVLDPHRGQVFRRG
ncbi:putative glycoside hydrolase [Kineococcus rhizosphaerae]|uniref:Putative glycosyl hydrolase-like family 15 (GHL15) protein n=1 Tax=Kineococcus rhizosphaerae TaxID=559628 RepID=A0A2T0R8B5_9ACTN|nr:putative glycoside hydrolase [Kineococcus rhizosphaerae]PRY17392.1 putative glycosyl hydrolase-like family 15 (GHL15) protein [Kineococcus rhizosphaerae]